MKIEWHPKAVKDLEKLAKADQLRIKAALGELIGLDDARWRLLPYSGPLKGFWKLRCGDYRLVCRLTLHGGQRVLVIYLAHRSRAYGALGEAEIRRRAE